MNSAFITSAYIKQEGYKYEEKSYCDDDSNKYHGRDADRMRDRCGICK